MYCFLIFSDINIKKELFSVTNRYQKYYMKESFFRTKWHKFKKYEILNNQIVPAKDSEYITYDPIQQNLDFKNKKKKSIIEDLLLMYEIEDDKLAKKELLKFAHKWGLPGSLMHECNEIIMHPMYLPFTYKDEQINEKDKKDKKKEKINLLFDHNKRKYNPSKKVKYIVHNFKYEKYLSYSGDVLHESESDKLGKSKDIYLNPFKAELDLKDPTNLKWPVSNFVHLCPQQIVYKFYNGKWIISSNFFTVSKINKDAIPGEIINKDNIKNKKDYKTPGYIKNILSTANIATLKQKQIDDEEGENYKRFIPFNGMNYKKINRDNKKIEDFVNHPIGFLEYFPFIRSKLWINNKNFFKDKDLAHKTERVFWPMPGTEKFFREYGETHIHDLYIQVKLITKMILEEIEKIKLKMNSKKEEQSLFNKIENRIRKLTNTAVPTFEFVGGKMRYYLHHPSLYSTIGHIILNDYMGDYYPRECKSCGTPYTPSRKEQKWCHDNCGRYERKKKSLKLKKKIEKKYLEKKISKQKYNQLIKERSIRSGRKLVNF